MSQKDKSESYENELRRSLNLMQFLLEDMAKLAINIKCGLWATSRTHSLICIYQVVCWFQDPSRN